MEISLRDSRTALDVTPHGRLRDSITRENPAPSGVGFLVKAEEAMKTNVTIMLAALLTGACFSASPSSESSDSGTGDETDDGTSSGTSGTVTDSSSTTSATSATDSGSTGGVVSTSGTTEPGSTGTDSSSATGSTSSTGGSTGGSTGSTGGVDPLFPDMYEPCEEHAECMSGVCVESFSEGQQETTHGFCSVLCDPMDANPCAGAESPFEGFVAECFWHPDDDKEYCGIQPNMGCPEGWRSQSQCIVETPPHPAGCYGACFEEV